MQAPKIDRLFLIVASAACISAALATHGLAQRGPSGYARRGPPVEAISACSGLEEGNSCAFSGRYGEMQGSCFQPPSAGELACRPLGRSQFRRSGSQGGGSERGGRFGPPPMRAHTAIQSDGRADLVSATQAPIADSFYSDETGERWRVLSANGVSEHDTGRFPNGGNPHRIAEQRYRYRVPASPSLTGETVSALGQPFGVAVNGVVFDPGANEFYQGHRAHGWQYEPLMDALNMGLDEHHAHVQPGGAYHYHGLPSGLLERLGVGVGEGSPLVGWAADGFPIYALYLPGSDRAVVSEMRSSYTLREGRRPSGAGEPGGVYDGTFTRDYEYATGHGTLDECNGASVVTPEFPRGTYAYFLTREWPVIPRCFKGTPSADFARRGPRGGARQRGRRR